MGNEPLKISRRNFLIGAGTATAALVFYPREILNQLSAPYPENSAESGIESWNYFLENFLDITERFDEYPAALQFIDIGNTLNEYRNGTIGINDRRIAGLTQGWGESAGTGSLSEIITSAPVFISYTAGSSEIIPPDTTLNTLVYQLKYYENIIKGLKTEDNDAVIYTALNVDKDQAEKANEILEYMLRKSFDFKIVKPFIKLENFIEMATVYLEAVNQMYFNYMDDKQTPGSGPEIINQLYHKDFQNMENDITRLWQWLNDGWTIMKFEQKENKDAGSPSEFADQFGKFVKKIGSQLKKDPDFIKKKDERLQILKQVFNYGVEFEGFKIKSFFQHVNDFLVLPHQIPDTVPEVIQDYLVPPSQIDIDIRNEFYDTWFRMISDDMYGYAAFKSEYNRSIPVKDISPPLTEYPSELSCLVISALVFYSFIRILLRNRNSDDSG